MSIYVYITMVTTYLLSISNILFDIIQTSYLSLMHTKHIGLSSPCLKISVHLEEMTQTKHFKFSLCPV